MKKSVMTAVLMATLGSSIFFAGCSSDSVVNTKPGATSEQKVNALNEYVDAVNWFNDWSLKFAYATAPDLAAMREGRPIDSLSLPSYGRLQEQLKNAVAAGSSSFEDVDSSTKEVLAVLDEMVPLSEKMKAYYDSKQYTTDNHAQGANYAKQYLALYEKFKVAYSKLDAATQNATHSIAAERIKAAKEAGRVQEATFREMYLVGSDVINLLEVEQVDANAVNAKIAELQKLNEALNVKGDDRLVTDVKQFKESVNRFIGKSREYVSQPNKGTKDVINAYNDMIEDMNDIDATQLDKK